MAVASGARAFVRKLALRVPPIRRMYSANIALQAQVRTLQSELETKDPAARHARPAAWSNWGDPSYTGDYMALWNRSNDHLLEPRFRRAYLEGMDTDHGLGTGGDLKIEWRIHTCCWAASHAAQLEGDFVECGTNTGIMSTSICSYLDFGRTDKRFFLFDTFEGIPVDQIGPGEEHALTQNQKYRDVYEIAKSNFAKWPNAKLVRGKVPDTLASVSIEQVAYLMIDMNIVEPERAALAHFWPKMVRGGIVLFDDYGWSGYHLQKKAHDEFAAAHGVSILTLPTGQGMLIKR